MKNFLDNGTCPIRSVLAHFGDKWSLLVMTALNSNGTMRFNEINKTLGDISHRMLTVTLRSLEEDGFISRRIYPEIPPRVEYTLTELGSSLIPHIEELVGWAVRNMDNIHENRRKFSRH
ncbi:MAG: helix-turn-helix transcriptional regulator [Rikenellaceae bacterium]|nr:helix-turn-helix transcriptional regulator [Rikenellaceae bacterium]